ncbi:MAG: sialate O-acetylesterase [Planctomycetota bacterium]
MVKRNWLMAWLAILMGGLTAQADVRLPAIIGNNMVLQSDMPLPIWGWADPGEEVKVRLGSSEASTKAGPDGKWRVTLPAQKANAKPTEVTVTGKNSIKLTNVLVGEVWAGSGQSNMQWSVAMSKDKDKEIQEAKYPNIRLFLVPLRLSPYPLEDVEARWVECSPETVPNFSAVLYFFGREIYLKEKVPVGLIAVSWGGSRIQSWITYDQYAAQPELKGELAEFDKAKADRQKVMETRKQLFPAVKAWVAAAEKALADGKDLPDGPSIPADPLNQFGSHSGMYNGMVHALVPYAIRGFLWYQGESNRGQGMHYHQLMRGLITNWRKLWNQGDFPFLYVQLAPYHYDNNETLLPEIWEAQTETLKIPATGMAVTTDITTVRDIHPPNKQDVGKRLALWALAHTYGHKDLVHSGPLYESMAVEGNKIRVKFKHLGGGLVANDGKALTWFSIAGEDKQFHPATATIDGDSVLVTSPNVAKPVAVRFGWNQDAEPNFANKAGLPASPFRTDRWTDAKNAPAN